MVQEATKNARKTAEKFAEDSNSKLGSIRKASQGQITIENRDTNTPYIKNIRVVNTVEYTLDKQHQEDIKRHARCGMLFLFKIWI